MAATAKKPTVAKPREATPVWKTPGADIWDALSVGEQPREVRVVAFKAIITNAISAGIREIRSHLYGEQTAVPEEIARLLKMDQRNEADDNERADKTAAEEAPEFQKPNPLLLASLHHAVYSQAYVELGTIIQDPSERPMTLELMLELQARGRGTPQEITKVLTTALGQDANILAEGEALMRKQQMSRLMQDIPHIRSIWNGFGDPAKRDDSDALSELPVPAQFSYLVKVAMKVAQEPVAIAMRIMRNQDLSETGSITLFRAAAPQLFHFAKLFEKKHRQEIEEFQALVPRAPQLADVERHLKPL